MGDAATQEELDAGRGYEALFVPALFAPWAHHLIESVAPETDAQVLDVACGTGVLARLVHTRCGPGGHVVGLDPAPGMLAAAQEVTPGVEWVSGRAEAMPFDAARFDVLLSQFGMMFFEDRAAAAAEMARVLKPGGRVALALWSSVADNPAYRDIASLLDEEVSAAAGDAVRVPFSLGDPDVVHGLLADAGFAQIRYETRTEEARFPSPGVMIEAELRGWLPLFGIHLDDATIADVLARAGIRLAGYAAPSGEAVFPTSAYIMTARKP